MNPEQDDEYLVEYGGEFWTGNRFSPYIGEALRYGDMQEASQAVVWIKDRLSIVANIMESPLDADDESA